MPLKQKLQPREVAEWCGVSVRMVYRWLSGKARPRDKHIQEIARRTDYQVTADDFYGLTEKRQAHRRARIAAGKES